MADSATASGEVAGVGIRLAGEADLPRVSRLWSALAADEQALGVPIRANERALESWLGSFARHLGRFTFLWVAEHEGVVKAFLLARLKTRPVYLGGELIGELCSIYVDPDLRGLRTGALLVRTAIRGLQDAGANAIEVDAHEANAAACKFWEAQGFRVGFRTYRWRPPPQ